MKPTVGRIVIYRSRTGNYDVPAIINATAATLDPKGVELGHVPALSGDEHVHLTVFTPGKPGTAREGSEVRSENVAGCYQEWNIPQDDLEDDSPADSVPSPGTWRWPERV